MQVNSAVENNQLLQPPNKHHTTVYYHFFPATVLHIWHQLAAQGDSEKLQNYLMCLFKHFLHVLFILTINVWKLQQVLNDVFMNELIIFHSKTKQLYMHKKPYCDPEFVTIHLLWSQKLCVLAYARLQRLWEISVFIKRMLW